MSNRYADDIRRIVGKTEIRGGLLSIENKAPISGKRGIGYFVDTTKPAGVSGVPGETLAPDDASSETPDGQVLNDDGYLLDPTDPNKGIFGPDTGVFNAKDILSSVEGEGIGPTLIGENKLLDITKGTLKQLNATDCASGKAIKMRTDGEFTPPDETLDPAGNLLTAAWTDPGIPPELVGWTLGKYWQTSGSGGPDAPEEGPTPLSSLQAALGYFNGISQADHGTDPTDTLAGSYILLDLNPTGPTSYFPTIQRSRNNTTTVTFSLNIGQVDCSGVPPVDSGLSCPAAAPVETQWPTQEEFQMTYNNGIFEAHIFDKNTPNAFLEDKSTLQFCYEDGGTKNGEMSVMANGAFSVYKTTGSGGPIEGVVRIYNNSGQNIAYTDAAGYHAYLGKLPTTGI